MTPPPARGPTVAVLGTGPCALALTAHLRACEVPTAARYLRPGYTLPSLALHPVVCVLYERPAMWDAVWPVVVPQLTPGTYLMQLGPHRLEDARRLVEHAAPRVQVLHTPLTWDTERAQLYCPIRSREVLRLAKRRHPQVSVHRRTLDALTALPAADPLTVLRPQRARTEAGRPA